MDMPNRRLEKELNDGSIDAAANIFKLSDVKGYLSERAFRFTDVAVTLKSRNIVIKTLSDLRGRSLITYQGAKHFLGEEFGKAAETCSEYTEIGEPTVQAQMIARGRADVSIGDIYIFLHSLRTWSDGKFTPEQFDIHRLFPDMYSHVGFRDKSVCDDFNRALKEIMKNGRYEAVYKNYLKKLGYKGD
jgi:ABC-type amino acid transport substrate-binding protein